MRPRVAMYVWAAKVAQGRTITTVIVAAPSMRAAQAAALEMWSENATPSPEVIGLSREQRIESVDVHEWAWLLVNEPTVQDAIPPAPSPAPGTPGPDAVTGQGGER